MAAITLRTYVFLDQMQDQLAGFIGTTARGYLPVGGVAAYLIETAPGLVINRLTDVALKATAVTPGILVVERSFGLLEVHYVAFAANEALKAARVKLIDASLIGAFGRLYLAGPEAQVDAASEAARRAIEAIGGRTTEV